MATDHFSELLNRHYLEIEKQVRCLRRSHSLRDLVHTGSVMGSVVCRMLEISQKKSLPDEVLTSKQFVRRLARCTLCERLRRAQRNRKLIANLIADYGNPLESSADDSHDRDSAEQSELINQFLQTLESDELREIAWLDLVSELPIREIAERTGLTEAKVKTRKLHIEKAKKRFRKQFDE